MQMKRTTGDPWPLCLLRCLPLWVWQHHYTSLQSTQPIDGWMSHAFYLAEHDVGTNGFDLACVANGIQAACEQEPLLRFTILGAQPWRFVFWLPSGRATAPADAAAVKQD